MIRGSIDEGYPTVAVTFHIEGRPSLQIECVVDTGFAGFLTLPSAAVSALGLPFFYKLPANLANDSDIIVDVYTATVEWHDEWRETEILAMGRRPLIGRSLLRGSEVCIEFIDAGRVSVDPIR